MEKTNATATLSNTILLLENKQAIEWEILKERASIVQESIKPMNLIKNAFKDATALPDGNNSIIDTGIGITAGYIAKQVLWGVSRGPMLNIFGTILQMGVTNFVTKHPNIIKSVGFGIFKRIFKKNEQIGH